MELPYFGGIVSASSNAGNDAIIGIHASLLAIPWKWCCDHSDLRDQYIASNKVPGEGLLDVDRF